MSAVSQIAFPRQRKSVAPKRATTVQHVKQELPSGTSGPGIASAPSTLPTSSSTGRPAPRPVPAPRQARTKVTVRSERWRILAAVKQATLEANASTLDPDEDPSIYQSGIFDDASVTSGQRFKGRIKSYNPRRGCGLIDCPETFAHFGQNVFLHKGQIGDLPIGMLVSFAVELGRRRRKPQARNVVARPRPSQQASIAQNQDHKRRRGHGPRR